MKSPLVTTNYQVSYQLSLDSHKKLGLFRNNCENSFLTGKVKEIWDNFCVFLVSFWIYLLNDVNTAFSNAYHQAGSKFSIATYFWAWAGADIYLALGPKEVLANSLSRQDQDLFKRVFQDLDQNQAISLADHLLTENDPIIHNPDREKYEFIIKTLRELYPSFDPYYAKGQEYPGRTAEQGLYRFSLSTKGIRFILEDLKKKGSLTNKSTSQDVQVFTCDAYENLVEKLSKSVEDMKSDKFDRCCFLLRQRKIPTDRSSHMTQISLRLEKNSSKQKFQIVITDSSGGNNKWIQDTTKKIDEIMKNEEYQVYEYRGVKRIQDHTNCAIFAIRDAVHMAQNFDENMQWIIENSKALPEKNHFQFLYLPLRMMQTTQSFSQIKNYLKKTNQLKTFIFSRSKSEGKTLLQSLKEKWLHPIKTEEQPDVIKFRNNKVACLYLKYEKLIFRHIIHSSHP